MPEQTKTYRVKTSFTDKQGKRWNAGDNYPAPKEGESKSTDLQSAIDAGQVQEVPAKTQNE